MKSERVYEALSGLPEDLIEDAGTHVFRRRTIPWTRFGAVAAAAVLILGLGTWGLTRSGKGPVSSGGGTGGMGDSGGNDGASGAYTYMSYAGPVFPLTALGSSEGITAERHTEFDFSPYETSQGAREQDGEETAYDHYETETIVTDRYLMTNEGEADRTLTLLYPAALSLSKDAKLLPALSLDGAPVSTTLYAGPYAGGFVDMEGKRDGERWNLAGLRDWEAYKALLESGGYQTKALEDAPALEEPVTVYKVDNYVVAPTDAVNPTLLMSFSIDYARTTVLTYGSNGGSDDMENGICGRDVGGLHREWAIHPMYVILLGDDTTGGYELQGYRNGGCEPGDEIEITATVERYESTLGAFLRRIVTEQLETDNFGMLPLEETTLGTLISPELVYKCVAEMFASYSSTGETPAERYRNGMLEDLMGDSFVTTRIFYAAAEVTIPAGETVELAARMVKEASFDYFGMGTEKGYATNGYDLATVLGSTLQFTAQYASVRGLEAVELLENSFGFDPAAGVTEVRLDPAQEHYWLKLRRAEG